MHVAYLFPFVLFLLIIVLYSFLTAKITLKFPQIIKEEVQTESLFSKFDSLYPKKEQNNQEVLPSINLLATASGSVRLALAQVNGDPKTLRIGSQIGTYKVVDIQRNYIVLSKGDQRIAIGFKFMPESFSDAPNMPTPSLQSSRSLQASIPKSELDRITADPGLMFRQIRLVPFVQEGRTRGFLFEWVEPGSIFERAGIKPGDVLLSINNQEIRSGEDAFRILQVLRNESSIRLSLQRGGEYVELLLRVE